MKNRDRHLSIWRYLPTHSVRSTPHGLPMPVAAVIVVVGSLLVALCTVFFIAFTMNVHTHTNAQDVSTTTTYRALSPHARRWT
jgi:hypothetical protein